MLANRKPLVVFFDTLFRRIRKAIPDYRAKAVRKNIAADEPVGSPIAIVKRMNIGEQKMDTDTRTSAGMASSARTINA